MTEQWATYMCAAQGAVLVDPAYLREMELLAAVGRAHLYDQWLWQIHTDGCFPETVMDFSDETHKAMVALEQAIAAWEAQDALGE